MAHAAAAMHESMAARAMLTVAVPPARGHELPHGTLMSACTPLLHPTHLQFGRPVCCQLSPSWRPLWMLASLHFPLARSRHQLCPELPPRHYLHRRSLPLQGLCGK